MPTERTDADKRFHPLFERWARRVRARLALRHALTGAAIGLLVALAASAVCWKTRHGAWRLYTPIAGVVGALGGLAIARRRRWSDSEVALYLDERLASDETITTAIEMRNESESDDPTRAVVVSTAASTLAKADARRARPRFVRALHLAAPIAIAGLVFVARAPLPPAPITAKAPGSTKVQLKDVEGLKKVAELAKTQARDEEQKKRLDQIARDAEKLREDLQKGLEKREAQDRIAKLRDAIAAERLSLGAGEKRAGLESAVNKLEENDLTREAGKALGDHDLEAMDSEMEKLANQREKKDRDAAKKQLEDAANEAKKNGANDVAKSLEQEEKLTDERGKRADTLRDLAKALEDSGLNSDELKQDEKDFKNNGDDKSAKKLADAMGKALEKLTPEERKKLADKLKERCKGGFSQGDAQDLKDLADELSTPEGQKQLEQELKDMANEDTEGDESKQQKDLDDAEEGAGQAEGDVGKGGSGEGENGSEGQGQLPGQAGPGRVPVPIPLPGHGTGKGTGGGGKGEKGGTPDPTGKGGGHGGVDQHGDNHPGTGDPVNADTFKSRAHGKMNKGQSMQGSTTGVVPGRAGGTANVKGTGELKSVGPGEVDGVERSDVPEEYRDQVRKYFQP